jgi:hypothetical protein
LLAGLESIYGLLEFASNNKSVPATTPKDVIGVEIDNVEKVLTYNALPTVYRKLVILPLKFVPATCGNSEPIVKYLFVILSFTILYIAVGVLLLLLFERFVSIVEPNLLPFT